mmetsp:Transcript_48487/g.89933  ORF Transcript_48487/g.89933 Transcript_48487/m.89933 type:complete len:281 (+) Transcript_48487:244-1086(+)
MFRGLLGRFREGRRGGGRVRRGAQRGAVQEGRRHNMQAHRGEDKGGGPEGALVGAHARVSSQDEDGAQDDLRQDQPQPMPEGVPGRDAGGGVQAVLSGCGGVSDVAAGDRRGRRREERRRRGGGLSDQEALQVRSRRHPIPPQIGNRQAHHGRRRATRQCSLAQRRRQKSTPCRHTGFLSPQSVQGHAGGKLRTDQAPERRVLVSGEHDDRKAGGGGQVGVRPRRRRRERRWRRGRRCGRRRCRARAARGRRRSGAAGLGLPARSLLRGHVTMCVGVRGM